ncbi:MAG: CotH kinase family protein [Anaerolineae bacterium]|jgi:spore coat protein CotH|nr:CotH kinase family protein [Anaerolineae bacterium]
MKHKVFLMLSVLILLLASCTTPSAQATKEDDTTTVQEAESGDAQETVESDAEVARPEGWSEESHGKSADPAYDVVFPQDEVNRLDITISAANWEAMLEDMTTLYGEAGTGDRGGSGPQGGRPEGGDFAPPDGLAAGEVMTGTQRGGPGGNFAPPGGLAAGQAITNTQRGGPGGNFAPPDGLAAGEIVTGTQRRGPGELAAGQVPTDTQRRGPGGGGPGGGQGGMPGNMGDNDENPIWVPVTIEFEDGTWTNVGLRFKGNSSLRSTWSSGNLKLPLRLNFDKFEDENPEIDDQRFYGFKELTLSSNFSDASFLREKITADIFREAGVPAAQTAFYEVYVDYGEGPVYFGLYTMVEVVEDTIIETQFDDDSGNVYKPSGNGATFAEGTFSEEAFEKQTNEDEGDWSDVEALFEALHAEVRTTDPEAWRSGLEAVFDVDGFLNWLAVNTVVQNWDTYGSMSHNYYLYHDPTTDQLTWIPWDNNMALSGAGRQTTGALDLANVNANWPLIRYLMDDEIYHAKYITDVEAVVNGAFEPAKMETTYRELAALIEPYVLSENAEHTTLKSEEAFAGAVEELVKHVATRHEAATEFVASQE